MLDVIIILFVLVACLFGYTYINKQENIIAPKNTTKVIYQIRTTESLPVVYEMINENTIIYDSLKNSPIGTIVKKESVATERFEVDLDKEIYVKSELPKDEYMDIILTIEADAFIDERDISIGDYVIKVGEQAFVKGKGYAAVGYVVSIER
jgi:hypothetical protein